MATVGGSSTTSTGHAKEHVVRAPLKPSGGPAGRNRVGGNKTVATAAAAQSVQRVGGPNYGGAGTKNPVGGGTTSTGKVSQHVSRPPDGRGGPGSPSGKTRGYPVAGKGGKGK